MNSPEIKCPICGSTQIVANKKGFSGKKAVAGALLTGGIGIIAGTIGSGKVKITCLACGHEFKPGEGNTSTVEPKEIKESCAPELDSFDKRLTNIIQQKGKLEGTKYAMAQKAWGMKVAKEYVDRLAVMHSIKPKAPEGCFIATACYGDYDAQEVLILRAYRDRILLQNKIGKLFVKFYYKISPRIANSIANSDRAKDFIRNQLLKPIVAKVRQKNKNDGF